jgi:V8-like Glu-specific endopeptidase
MGNSSTDTDFGHSCDTDNSSSGSPVQIFGSNPSENGKVIGIHHLGFRTDTVQAAGPELINRAVRMELIIDYIRRTKPNLLQELGIP